VAVVSRAESRLLRGAGRPCGRGGAVALRRLSVVVWTCGFAGGQAVAALPGSASAGAAGPGLSGELFRERRPSGRSEPEPWGLELGRGRSAAGRPWLLGSHGPVPG
jgi:hypothetical protein